MVQVCRGTPTWLAPTVRATSSVSSSKFDSLRVLDTLNPVVDDFLPAGFSHVSTALGAQNTIDVAGVTFSYDATANRVTYSLANVDIGGKLLQGIITTEIVDPNAAKPGDLLGNLMKFRYTNTAGAVFQLREDANVEWSEPILTLDKSVATVNGVAPTANPAIVREGDRVVYRVAVTNTGTANAFDVSVRDVLPAQIQCANVGLITNSGACETAPTPDRIQWDQADDIDIAAGATATLAYEVLVPAGVTPGITLTNRAGVRDYRGPTNTSTPFTYVPANNIDTTLTPNTTAADDTAAIFTELPTVLKTRSTEINQSGNNTASQATIGERISYNVSVNVPPGTTVTNARITDVLDAEKDLVASSVVATRNGVALPASGFTINVDDAGNRFTVTPPDPYVVAPGPTGDTIVVTFEAIVTNVASNTRGTTTGNTVNLAYNNALGPRTISASVNTTIVEPNIDLTKRNDDADGVVAPGQTITYSLDVLNRNQTVGPPSVAIAGVSTANDTVVTDVVPAELIVLEAPGDPAEDGDTIAPNGGTWDATSRTITWTIPTINPGATTTRSYQVQTADPLVAAGAMINNAEARTTSFPGTPAGPAIERASTTSFGGPGSGYQDPAQSTVTAPVLSATKAGTPDVATVGDTVTYTVTATVPAGVIAADVTVLDTLPVGTTYESLTSVTCLQGVGACSPDLNAASVTTSGQNLSFFLGDLTTPAVGDRTVTITYVAYVANVPAADAGATLRNGAAIYWNATNKITGNPTTPPAAGTFDRSSLPSFDDVATVEPRLTIDKDVRGQVADLDTRRSKPGDVLTFDVTVANTGSGPAYDIIVSDSPDPRLTGYSFTPVTGVVNSDSTPTDGTLEWTIAGPIAAGSSATITYSLTVPASWNSAEENPVGPELTNTADVPSYFALPQSVRSANPTRSFRNYDNVTADVVTIELDLASIGDLVWFDVDGDGVRDAAEPPIANVDVIVTYLGANGVAGGGDDETFTMQTDANGRYLVDRLPGGNYTVDVLESDPQFIAGLVPSYDQDGGTVSPNGVWAGTLGQAEDRRDVDFGYTGTGSIGDTIWFDRNGNGTKDVGEAGLAGVPVTVTWFGPDGVAGGTDDIAYSTATDAAGNYLVSRLPAGNFGVVVDATALTAAGYVNVTDPNGGNDSRSLVTLVAAQNNLAQDFGYRGAGTIGDRIWLDSDGDGSQDVGEQGLMGVTVQLVSFGPDGVAGGSDDSTFTTVAGADGSYLFNFLPRGEYRVSVQGGLPGGVTNSGDPDGGANSTSRVTLTVGAPDNLTQDFGYDAQSVLGDRVWWDLDRDGVPDLGEPGIGAVAVRATGPNGLVLNTTTDAAGSYLFTDLPDGPWTVAVISGVPNSFGPTFDADGLGTPGTSSTTLATSNLLQDFGYAGTGSIGDRVWLDRDSDGVQDLGEPGIEDTTVELTWFGPNGIVGGGDDVVLTRTTDANGDYQFVGLPAGNFSVAVVTTDPDFPSGVSPTFDRDGTTITPNGIALVALTTGQAVTDADFGYRGGGSIGDTIWFDRDGDGAVTSTEPGIAGVDVTLLWFGEDGVLGGADDELFTTTTDAAGNYLFSGLPPGEYRVTVDTADLPVGMVATFDVDGGLDSTSRLALADGAVNLLQDFGYRGAASIGDTVYLDLDGNGIQGPGEPGVPGQTVELTWQSPSGPVTFATTTSATGGYLFANLPDGSYQVRVVGGIAAVASNTADPDGASDSTSAVTVSGGVSNLVQDFGYQGNNTLGDRVWWDQNADGVFDAVEPGIANVTLSAIWFGPDGVAGGGDDIALPSTVTDSAGTYRFESLPDGNYSVAVTSGLPSGLTTNTYDSDNGMTNPNGTSIVNGLGVGTLAPASNLEQDFGYSGTGSIGDTIWLDLDSDGMLDAGEPGIAGAVITLTWSGADGLLGTADDVVYPSEATDTAGKYLFERLPAGPFRVDVTNLPAGVGNTADPDGNADNTAVLTLAPSQINLSQDFAYRGTATVGDTIWLDVDGDKVQGPNEPGMPGITVTVISQGADGTLGTADDVIVTVVTDVDGRYLVTGLPAGGTMVSYRTSDLGAALEPNSDLDGGDLTTAAVVLNNGDDVRTLDFGVVGSSTVSGVVWKDTNGDGTRDTGEVGVPGVTVIVTWAGPKGPIDLTVITGPNGDWALSRVPAGDYSVRTVASTYPPGLSLSTAAVATVNVPPGGTGRVVHGLTPNGAVGDRVWSDTNRNGVQDPGESGVPGVRISLRNPAGNVVASVVTDSNGNYRFADLPPGTYTVEVDTATLPSGSAIVFDPDGSNDGRFIVVVGPGDDIMTVDFGVAPATTGLGTLPATGATIVRILTVALSLVAFGWLLFGTSRRRSRVRT